MNTPLRPTSPHLLDPDTDARLRALDAAGPVTDADRSRADDLLASIVATDPTLPAATAAMASMASPARVVPLRRRPVARWALAAAALAVAGSGAVVVSTFNATPAFATWTAEPARVTAADSAVVVAACRDKAGKEEWYDARTLDVRLTERRGDYVAVLLTGAGTGPAPLPPEVSISCIGRLPAGSDSVDDLTIGASGGGGFAAPTGRQFYEGAMSQFAMGGGLFGQGGEPASFVDGRVGPDVAKLTIHAAGRSVDASVKDGTYAAWWPGRAFPDEPLPPSGQGGPEPILTYDVTLKDGTVLEDVDPTRPHGTDSPEAGQAG